MGQGQKRDPAGAVRDLLLSKVRGHVGREWTSPELGEDLPYPEGRGRGRQEDGVRGGVGGVATVVMAMTMLGGSRGVGVCTGQSKTFLGLSPLLSRPRGSLRCCIVDPEEGLGGLLRWQQLLP